MNSNRFLVALATLGFAAALPSAVYAGQLVTNGGFETNGGNGQLGNNTTATGWSISGGYAFIFNADGGTTSGTTADNGGANGEYGGLSLWGPGTGANNGLTVSPTGGAFEGQDSAFQQAAITQTITGLTAGNNYLLSFDWAAAQQAGFGGQTSTQWQVSLGSQTQTTAFANIPTAGFSGWMHQTFDYTATGPSEVLSFLANGSPSVPPFALLDSVSLQAVPEKGTGVAMMLGVVGFGVFARRRARSKSSK